MRRSDSEFRALERDYEERVGSYRRELAQLQGELDRVKAELEYARTVVDGIDMQDIKALDFWRKEAGRASAAEKRAIEYADLRLATVEARERELGSTLSKATEGGFKRGWAQALLELEDELGFDEMEHIEVLRYESVDGGPSSPFFRMHKETMRELVERLKERGENWDQDEEDYGSLLIKHEDDVTDPD